MKQINVTMDANGHITHGVNGGVMGDHHAATLCLALSEPPEGAGYYRLYFANADKTLVSEQLYPTDGIIRYSLPDRVTRLGTSVLCQLCAYTEQAGEFTLVFKSDPFPLGLATSLPDTSQGADSPLTNQMEEYLNRVQDIAEHFDLTVGKVETLPYDQAATATVSQNTDMKFTLDLGIPCGEKGDGNFTEGNGISITNGAVSVKMHQRIYQASENSYSYLHLPINEDLPDLVGMVFLVNPRYTNTWHQTYICTNAGIYHTLYRYDGASLSDQMPNNAIVPNRPMLIYVNQSGQPVYLNPNYSHQSVSAVLTVTPDYSNTGMPQLTFPEVSDTFFSGGRSVIATATDDVVFDGSYWYGPMCSGVTVYYNGKWTNTSHLNGKVIPAGQPLLMYLDYDPSNYSYSVVKLLNPPV